MPLKSVTLFHPLTIPLFCSAKAVKKKTTVRSFDPILGTGELSQEVATDNPVIPDKPAIQDAPPHQDSAISPAHTSPPLADQERENIIEEQPTDLAQDEIAITGKNQNPPPEASTALTKIPTKVESPRKDKGKAVLHYHSFEDQDISFLHQAVLTRLSESRDTEIAMVTSLKRKYDVICFSYPYIYM